MHSEEHGKMWFVHENSYKLVTGSNWTNSLNLLGLLLLLLSITLQN